MKTRLGVLKMKVMMHPLLVHPHLRLLLVLITQTSITVLSASSDDLSEATFFERRIRPLLLDHCQDCHGTLNEGMPHLPLLDSREAFVGDSALVVPGSPAESRLIQALENPTVLGNHPDWPKPMMSRQKQDLERWIEMGAPWPASSSEQRDANTDGNTSRPEGLHWSFRALVRPALPDVPDSFRIHNPIDRFVVQKLIQSDLSQADPAPSSTLIRRIYFDLLGLPPSPTMMRSWLDRMSRAKDAASEDQVVRDLIETLLAHPAYGERWARHWLDVARYSEVGGWTQDNRSNPKAFHYRDWVIQAFNQDLPFHQFVSYQIAGDLLANGTSVATGFFSLGPNYASDGGDPESIAQAKGETLDDRVDTFSRAFLGLTVSCARCHDHKFDPIPIEDYYSIAGVFNNTGEVEMPLVDHGIVQAYEAGRERIRNQEKVIKDLRDQSKKLSKEHQEEAKAHIESAEALLKVIKKEAPSKYEYAHVVQDKSNENMHVALRGDLLKKGELVPRRFLRILTQGERTPYLEGSGRRQLAESVVSPENPLSVRVFVNRIWMHHFGRALVRSPDNFGRLGEKPTHPELLDWLALEFAGSGGSVKHLHRLIMHSATYRSSSTPSEKGLKTDADNRLFWRMDPRRMDVETWRDALLSVTQELDASLGGPSQEDITQSARRTLYAKTSRNDPTASDRFLRLFNFPIPRASAAKRTQNIVPQQFLFMLNSPFMLERAQKLALSFEASSLSLEVRIDQLHETLFGRRAEQREVEHALTFLKDFEIEKEHELSAWAAYCQVLLCSNEFMFIR